MFGRGDMEGRAREGSKGRGVGEEEGKLIGEGGACK